MALTLQNPDNRGKWLCGGCRTWNKNEVSRCGWCGKAKPGEASSKVQEQEALERQQLVALHNAVEKSSHQKRLKLAAWMESDSVKIAINLRTPEVSEELLRTRLHECFEHVSHQTRVTIWRWMEDNLI